MKPTTGNSSRRRRAKNTTTVVEFSPHFGEPFLCKADLSRPLLIWLPDRDQCAAASAECAALANECKRIPLIISPEPDRIKKGLLNIELLRAGGCSETSFALNPLEVLPFVDVREHIEHLVGLFTGFFTLTPAAASIFRFTLELAYKSTGWNLLSGKNERIYFNDVYYPEIHPDLWDLQDFLSMAAEESELPPYVAADAEGTVRNSLNIMTSGLLGQVFSRRTAVSLTTLFDRPRIINVDLLSLICRGRLMLDSLLLLFCSEFFQTDAVKGLIILDYPQIDPNSFPPGNADNCILSQVQRLVAKGSAVVLSTSQTVLPNCLNRKYFGTVVSTLTLLKKHFDEPPLFLVRQEDESLAPNCVIRRSRFAAIKKWIPSPLTLAPSFSVATGFYASAGIENSSSISQMISYGYTRFPDAFEAQSLEYGRKVVRDRSFWVTFIRYVLSTKHDLTQLVHFRAQITHEVQRILLRAPVPLPHVRWCALSLATDRFFRERARFYSWSNEEETELRTAWYSLMAPAFIPADVNRRLDISVMGRWRERYEEAHKVDQGPLRTCGNCSTKCQYGVDAVTLTNDPKVIFDFNSSINRKDTAASESAAWFARLLAERLIGQSNLDLAYCLSVHLIDKQQLSTDGQLVLLEKVRASLVSFAEVESTEIAEEKLDKISLPVRTLSGNDTAGASISYVATEYTGKLMNKEETDKCKDISAENTSEEQSQTNSTGWKEPQIKRTLG